MNVQIFSDQHISKVYDYELCLLSKDLDPIQAQMKSWEAPWRKESLDYYSKTGWSFVSLKADDLQGYLLAQPLLFFNHWTQSLWIEAFSFQSEEVGFELMDSCIRWSKTKHLQKVLIHPENRRRSWIQKHFPFFEGDHYLHLSTTKISVV